MVRIVPSRSFTCKETRSRGRCAQVCGGRRWAEVAERVRVESSRARAVHPLCFLSRFSSPICNLRHCVVSRALSCALCASFDRLQPWCVLQLRWLEAIEEEVSCAWRGGRCSGGLGEQRATFLRRTAPHCAPLVPCRHVLTPHTSIYSPCSTLEPPQRAAARSSTLPRPVAQCPTLVPPTTSCRNTTRARSRRAGSSSTTRSESQDGNVTAALAAASARRWGRRGAPRLVSAEQGADGCAFGRCAATTGTFGLTRM